MAVFSTTILCAFSIWIVLYVWNSRLRKSKLPPGPPRLPIIGNLHQAPKEAVWTTYEKWVEQYGPLVYLDFGGTNVLIIGDHEIAKDLLDKKANIYSSRPRMVMAQELTCKNKHIMFKSFGEDFLLHQRLEAPVLNPRASACYTAIQDLESKHLLNNFLYSNDFPKQFERFAASIVYSTTFGMRIITGEEWQLQTSHKCLKNFTLAGQVGAWIVDIFPFLNNLPAPLTPWKKTAEAWYTMWENLHMTNMHDALQRPGWNWTKELNASKEVNNLSDSEIAWDLGILLPYLQAVVEENFRWRHIVPSGIPHATTQEDSYRGYLIPKGSIVVPLFSAMRKDKHTFDSPEEFRPERWLGKSQPSNFGYGRRICPGRFIARNSLAIAMARMLWAFNIRHKNGKKIVVTEDMFTTGFVSAPKPFGAVFEPRSDKHRGIIEKSFEAADKDVVNLMNEIRGKQVSAGLTPCG